MNDEHGQAPSSEAGALVRLGLKVAFAKRGEYLAEYLDDRRIKRIERRLTILGDSASTEGLSGGQLLKRVQDDDDAAEFLDEVLEAAVKARYEPKLQYLGKSLAQALRTQDDAIPDMKWERIRAVKDLEAIHVRLLDQLRREQDHRRSSFFRSQSRLGPPVPEYALIEDQRLRRKGMPASTFFSVIALLIRHGLVASETDVEVEINVEINKTDESAAADPTIDVTQMYRLTDLGREILNELEAAELTRNTRAPVD